MTPASLLPLTTWSNYRGLSHFGAQPFIMGPLFIIHGFYNLATPNLLNAMIGWALSTGAVDAPLPLLAQSPIPIKMGVPVPTTLCNLETGGGPTEEGDQDWTLGTYITTMRPGWEISVLSTKTYCVSKDPAENRNSFLSRTPVNERSLSGRLYQRWFIFCRCRGCPCPSPYPYLYYYRYLCPGECLPFRFWIFPRSSLLPVLVRILRQLCGCRDLRCFGY